MAKVNIIAEIGINHGGNIKVAHLMIDEAYKAGADIIKFQMVNACEVYDGTDELFTIFKKVEFTTEQWIELEKHVLSLDRQMLITPGDKHSVDTIASALGIQMVKVASDAAKDVKFVNYVMDLGLETIVSMGQMENTKEILYYIKKYKQAPDVVFHCVSKYPTEPLQASLNRVRELATTGMTVGYSDHVPGFLASVVAPALGATFIEKHLKLNDDCVDAPVSITPREFAKMVRQIRQVEAML